MGNNTQWKSKQLKFKTSWVFFLHGFICWNLKGLHWGRLITVTIKGNNRNVSGKRGQLSLVPEKGILKRINLEEKKRNNYIMAIMAINGQLWGQQQRVAKPNTGVLIRLMRKFTFLGRNVTRSSNVYFHNCSILDRMEKSGCWTHSDHSFPA